MRLLMLRAVGFALVLEPLLCRLASPQAPVWSNELLSQELRATAKAFHAAADAYGPSLSGSLRSDAAKLLLLDGALTHGQPGVPPAGAGQWVTRVAQLAADADSIAVALQQSGPLRFREIQASLQALGRAIDLAKPAGFPQPLIYSVRLSPGGLVGVLGHGEKRPLVLWGAHLGRIRGDPEVVFAGSAPLSMRVRSRESNRWELETRGDAWEKVNPGCGELRIGAPGPESPGQPHGAEQWVHYPVCVADPTSIVAYPVVRLRYEKQDSIIYALEPREFRLESKDCLAATRQAERLNWALPPATRLLTVQLQTLESRGVGEVGAVVLDAKAGTASVQATLLPSKCVAVSATRQEVVYSSLLYGIVRPLASQATFTSQWVAQRLDTLKLGERSSVSSCTELKPGAPLRELQIELHVEERTGTPVAVLRGDNVPRDQAQAGVQQRLPGVDVEWKSLAADSDTASGNVCVTVRPRVQQ